MQETKYNIGLDIGTNSVGWAVVRSDNFNIIRKGGKKLWGVRLFEEAKTAADRRLFRSNRRRLDRRRERIKLLREIFNNEINKVDPNFFKKMQETFYNEKDLKNKTIKITKEEKELILRSASEAASAGNQQMYTILDITDQKLKDTLTVTCDNQPFIAKADLVLVFCVDFQKWYDTFRITGCDPRKPEAGDFLLAVLVCPFLCRDVLAVLQKG